MLNNGKISRKLIHFFTGIIILLLTWLTGKSTLLWIISGGSLFAFATFPFKKFNFIHKTTYNSYGTLFYPLGILSAYLILYNLPLNYFRIVLLLLTVSDTVANIAGRITRNNIYFRAAGEKKSLFGLLGFALTAWLIFYLFLPDKIYNNTAYLIFFIVASVNFEIISFRGSDNFSIPLGIALIFNATEFNSPDKFAFLNITIIALAAGSYMLYRFRLLSRAGSLNAYLLGIFLFGFLAFPWAIPVIFFFLSSVFFTKINASVNKKTVAGSHPRNSWQVIANSMPAIAFSAAFLLTKNPLFIFLFTSTVSAVTADTWASEIGPVFNRKCLSLADFRTGKAGISGGISVAGSLAALMGSFSIAIITYYLFPNQISIRILFLITLSGFFASFIDSLLGAHLEPVLLKKPYFSNKNIYAVEKLTPNDLVNILGSLSASLFFIILW